MKNFINNLQHLNCYLRVHGGHFLIFIPHLIKFLKLFNLNLYVKHFLLRYYYYYFQIIFIK